jgi:hypothetical protein
VRQPRRVRHHQQVRRVVSLHRDWRAQLPFRLCHGCVERLLDAHKVALRGRRICQKLQIAGRGDHAARARASIGERLEHFLHLGLRPITELIEEGRKAIRQPLERAGDRGQGTVELDGQAGRERPGSGQACRFEQARFEPFTIGDIALDADPMAVLTRLVEDGDDA